jgi:hypothetical protein
MPFVPFHLYFPDFSKKETRSLFVPPATIPHLPAGNYGFIELYCDEPGCDCRRVFFNVVSERRRKIEAVIAWGWEDLDFYAKWMRKPDPVSVKNLRGPILNPGSPMTELAPMLLQLTQNVLLQDAEYRERIKRHYHVFREKIDRPSPNESQLRNRRILSPRTAVPLETGTGYVNKLTDEHLDVLQNLEFAIVTTYKQRPEMTDYDVMRIMETLIDGYQAETIGRPPRYTPVTDMEIDLRDNLRRMCEWRLGRIQLVKDERMKELEKTDPKTLDEIVACLKKLHNSARKWNKSGGRRGYLDFVVKYIG